MTKVCHSLTLPVIPAKAGNQSINVPLDSGLIPLDTGTGPV